MSSNEVSLAELLRQLEVLLLAHGEKNWLRGVTAVREALASSAGLDEARSIYVSMNSGAGSFADYNVWADDFDERVKLNRPLDHLRTELWKQFGLGQ